jgi:anti-sigma B factor antagonist
MSVQCASDGRVLTICLTDAKILDAPTIEQIHQEIVAVLEKTDQPDVLIDFRAVKFMSSAALGMLIRVNKKCKEFKINLKLCNIERDIKQVFKITGLDKVFTIYNSAEDAYSAFAKRP